jgi:hypothetical protein
MDVSTCWSIEEGRRTATRNFKGNWRCHGDFRLCEKVRRAVMCGTRVVELVMELQKTVDFGDMSRHT